MDFSLSVTGLVLATLFLVVFLKFRGKRTPKGLKELPGPAGLPLLGNIHQLGQFPNKQYCKWHKEFGKIFKVQLFNKTVVVVADPKSTKEIFSQAVFNGKPFVTGMYDENDIGAFRTEGPYWEAHRRFLLRQLDLELGKSPLHSLIMNEVIELIFTIRSKHGQPLSKIHSMMRISVVNSLMTILLSKRFKHEDPELMDLTMKITDALDDTFRKGAVLLFAPWLRKIIPKLSVYSLIKEMNDENRKRFTKFVEQHKATLEDGYSRDFTDAFLTEIKKAERDPTSPFHGERAERHLIMLLFDLFIAATDKTAATISWFFLYVSKLPEIQNKLQSEIMEVTGNCRPVSVEDRVNMPYTLALIDEVLRHSSVASDGGVHRAVDDAEFEGYRIPKDSFIQPNIYYIHYDPDLWGDPENFRPERFLSPDGKTYVSSENMQPFQVGKRKCPGEKLARNSLFLYMTNLAQQFNIAFAPGTNDPGFESNVGFLRNPMPYSVIMDERDPS